MECVNWGEIPTEWKDHLVLLKDYQYERHWEGSGGFWGPGFPSLKLVPKSNENNNTSSRPLRRSWNLNKCDDQHLSERYILFFWSLRYPYQKYTQMVWDLYIGRSWESFPVRVEALVKNALHRLTFLNTWSPVSVTTFEGCGIFRRWSFTGRVGLWEADIEIL